MTGRELKELRKRKKLTQLELAKLLKVGVSTLKQWEIGYGNISPAMGNYIKIIFREIPLPIL